MTTNAVTDNEVEQIEQCKRDTLHSLLRISMEQQGPQKFADLDVKGIAKKVNEAYDQLGNNYTVMGAISSPLSENLNTIPGGNVMNMYPGSDASKTGYSGGIGCAGSSSFKTSKKEYAKFPEPAEVLIALPAGADQTLKPWESSFNLPEGMTTGQVSDGYHTFDELYAHRVRLFSTLMRAHPDKSWWSFRHHDGSAWDGWIIAGIDTPAGTATYHLPVSEIDFFSEDIRQLEKGKEWDGHTADDVLERLKSL